MGRPFLRGVLRLFPGKEQQMQVYPRLGARAAPRGTEGALSYLDPHCALGPRGAGQEDLKVPSEDRRGDHAGAGHTAEGASVAGKHTGETGIFRDMNELR